MPAPYQPYCGERVLVMQYFDGRPLLAAAAGLPAESRAALARVLLDSLLGQVMLDGIFHADPHPGNILLLGDGHLGPARLGRLSAGSTPGCAARCSGCCWRWTAAIPSWSPTPCSTW